MKSLALLSLSLALSNTGHGEQVVSQYDWSKPPAPPGTTSVTVDGRTALLVKSTNPTGLTVHLLRIPSPGVTANTYAIIGEVKYEGVRGDGFFEMWSSFPPVKLGLPEGQYFSRTLGVSGEMAKLTGSSDWRRFVLPFDRTGSSGPPTRLDINLVLPGEGTVHVGPLKLIDLPSGLGSISSPGAWWSDRSAGLIGGIGGALLGCLGSLLAWMASRGQARSFVLRSLQTLIVLGAVAGVAGLVAVILRQPYAVWFPLVLGAVLLLGILPARLRQYRRQFELLELRRMDSVDARG